MSFSALSKHLNNEAFKIQMSDLALNKKILGLKASTPTLTWDLIRKMGKLKKWSDIMTQIVGMDSTLKKGKESLHEVESFFAKLFAEEGVDLTKKHIFFDALPQVSDELGELYGIVKETEIAEAIKASKDGTSPGNDGLGYSFYKIYASRVIPLLCRVYNEIFQHGRCPENFHDALITLIPKKEDAVTVDDWRPISLLNTDYKILTRVLATRLQKVLPLIIGKHQTCALSGHSIATNIKSVRDLLQARGL